MSLTNHAQLKGAEAFLALNGQMFRGVDVATASPAARLDALLDRAHVGYAEGDELPPGRHILYFLSSTLQSDLRDDGGNPRDNVLPATSLNQAIWAGTRVEYRSAIRIGDRIERVTTLKNLERVDTPSGELVRLTLQDEISTPRGIAVAEETDLMFRRKPAVATAPPEPPPAPAVAAAVRNVVADTRLLFRFSALVFNAHRIHYDLAYTRDVEGYPGLIVHGPLQTALLLDLVRRSYPQRTVRSAQIRSHRPVFAGDTLTLKASQAQGASVVAWNEAADGRPTLVMTVALDS